MACLFVYWQYHTLIKVSIFCLCCFLGRICFPAIFAHCSQEAEAALQAAGLYNTDNFTSLGPAGIFALYANPADPLGLVFLNEFVSVRGRAHTPITLNPDTLIIGFLHRHSNCCVSRSDELLYSSCCHALGHWPDIVSLFTLR